MLRNSLRAVVLVAAVIALYFVCVVPYRANLTLQEVSQRSETAQSSDTATSAILARQNLEALERVAGARRLDPAWYMLYAGNCVMLGRLPAAADAYTRALRIDDRPELYVNRGQVLYHLGRTDEAVADLVKAARFDPTVLEHLDGELRARVAAAMGRP